MVMPACCRQVERANRTHTEEFYEVYPTSFTIADLNQELKGLGVYLQLCETSSVPWTENTFRVFARIWYY